MSFNLIRNSYCHMIFQEVARCINWEKKTPEFPYGKDPVFGLILKGFWVQEIAESVPQIGAEMDHVRQNHLGSRR